jgi:hypothetical protein
MRPESFVFRYQKTYKQIKYYIYLQVLFSIIIEILMNFKILI